jgi:hypothetical protein
VSVNSIVPPFKVKNLFRIDFFVCLLLLLERLDSSVQIISLSSHHFDLLLKLGLERAVVALHLKIDFLFCLKFFK